ncbi:MAG TPA: hypothetical protein DET40_05055 [Lentisphaeria bacterium]|nr:MAG: hypothetical protein A2X45_13630 [Lentisphaerae bacterium GWF2_50_93]HCE42895.1 hypothetical protein [Lentisphaeria bacterium]
MKTFACVIQDRKDEFTRIFDLPGGLFMNELMTVVTKRFYIDIIRLDDWMAAHKGYDIDRDGSLEDFIRKTYGEDAVRFIKENMSGGFANGLQKLQVPQDPEA